MWPSGKNGEDSRLYNAVESCSDFAIELGINIPTGKDSLSMVQKYDDTNEVKSPGTVIISASAHCSDIRKVVTPNLKGSEGFIEKGDNEKTGTPEEQGNRASPLHIIVVDPATLIPKVRGD